MKKLLPCILTMLLFVTFAAAPVQAATATTTSVPAPKPAESAQTQALVSRLNEIKTMDKSSLSASEKKQLRKEKRSIKSELRRVSGGVYLSTGAIIIIIVILILVL